MTIVFNIDFTTENVTVETTNALTFGEGGGGGGAVDSVNGQTGVVILTAANISETSTRLWLTDVLKTAYDSAVAWIATNGANLLNHLANLSNPHQTTASQVGAYTTSETDTLLNAKANDNAVVKKTDYTPAHSFLVQQSGTGTPTALQVGNNTLVGRLSGGGSNIDDLSVSQVKTLLSYTPADIGAQPALGFTPENVANKTTNIAGIAGTYPDTPTVKTYADSLKPLIASDLPESTTTSTSEVIVKVLAITGNSLNVGDLLEMYGMGYTNQAATNTFIVRFRIGTDASPGTPSGYTQIGQSASLTISGASGAGLGVLKMFSVGSNFILGLPSASTFSPLTSGSGDSSPTQFAIDRTATNYLYISVTGNSAGTKGVYQSHIKKYKP